VLRFLLRHDIINPVDSHKQSAKQDAFAVLADGQERFDSYQTQDRGAQ